MADTVDLQAALHELEGLPLLGSSLERVRALRSSLTRHLASHPDPLALLRTQLRFGALLLVLEAPEASRYLMELCNKATHAGATVLAARAALLAARADCLGGEIHRARATVRGAEAQLQGDPEAGFDFMLARALTSPTDAEALLVRALDKLPPHRDHDRLAALLELADRCERGGDPYRARRCLDQALALAERHQATRQQGRVALLLGSLQLREGDLAGARASLERALLSAEQVKDSLVTAAAGTLNSGLLLHDGAWEPLLELTARLLPVAEQRVNPALVVSLTLDRATAFWALRRHGEAVGTLLHTALALEASDEQLPLNLLKARFAEMLEELGQERFEDLVRAQVAQLRAEG